MSLMQVFDCWFESGSMPYAYIHYPFENRELFDNNFPGHFVAEGLDQTRGWLVLILIYRSYISRISEDTVERAPTYVALVSILTN